MIQLVEYQQEFEKGLTLFWGKCLPESGRIYDPQGRHIKLTNIKNNFEKFWVLTDYNQVIGTVAINKINNGDCELKCLYLYKKFQGLGYGRKMLETAIEYACAQNYRWIYLDTMKTSKNAIALYKKLGFVQTKRYNDNEYTDIFMRHRL